MTVLLARPTSERCVARLPIGQTVIVRFACVVVFCTPSDSVWPAGRVVADIGTRKVRRPGVVALSPVTLTLAEPRVPSPSLPRRVTVTLRPPVLLLERVR